MRFKVGKIALESRSSELTLQPEKITYIYIFGFWN